MTASPICHDYRFTAKITRCITEQRARRDGKGRIGTSPLSSLPFFPPSPSLPFPSLSPSPSQPFYSPSFSPPLSPLPLSPSFPPPYPSSTLPLSLPPPFPLSLSFPTPPPLPGEVMMISVTVCSTRLADCGNMPSLLFSHVCRIGSLLPRNNVSSHQAVSLSCLHVWACMADMHACLM